MDRTQFQKHIDDLLELALKDSNQTAKHKKNQVAHLESSMRYRPKTMSTCADCGELVKYQRTEYLVRGLSFNRPYWRKNCLNCPRTWIINPDKNEKDK